MNVYIIAGRGRYPLSLKGFLSMALKAEFTSEMFMHFYLRIKNKLRSANSVKLKGKLENG